MADLMEETTFIKGLKTERGAGAVNLKCPRAEKSRRAGLIFLRMFRFVSQ